MYFIKKGNIAGICPGLDGYGMVLASQIFNYGKNRGFLAVIER
jgi:hypothetical protein